MDEDAVSPIVGTILLVAITIVMAGTAFLLVQEQSESVEGTPRVAFQSDHRGSGGTLTVAAVNGVVGTADWAQVQVVDSSTAACTLPTGTLAAGGVVQCTSEGTLVLSYRLPSGDTVLIFDGEVR